MTATRAAARRQIASTTGHATRRHDARARAVHLPEPSVLVIAGGPKGEQMTKKVGRGLSVESTPDWCADIRRLATRGRHDTYCARFIAHALRYDYPGLEVTPAEVAAEAERCGLRLLGSPSVTNEVTP